MFGCGVQFAHLRKAQLAQWPRSVGGPVHGFIVHQDGNTVCGELQIQLHSRCSICTGLERNIHIVSLLTL